MKKRRKKTLGECEVGETVTLITGVVVDIQKKAFFSDSYLVYNRETQSIEKIPFTYYLTGSHDDWIICKCSYCDNEFAVPPHLECIPDYCCYCLRQNNFTPAESLDE